MTDDERALSRIRSICRRWPEVEEVELQDRPLFRVRARRFAIFNGADAPARPRWAGCGPSLHVVSDPDEHSALQQDPRFRTSPHHGDRGWVSVSLDDAVDWAETGELLESAYRRVAGRELIERLDRA